MTLPIRITIANATRLATIGSAIGRNHATKSTIVLFHLSGAPKRGARRISNLTNQALHEVIAGLSGLAEVDRHQSGGELFHRRRHLRRDGGLAQSECECARGERGPPEGAAI